MRWIRLWTNETLQSTTFQELDLPQRGLWHSLLVMAGHNLRHPGIIELRDSVPYSIPTLAEIINCTESELQQGLHRLQEVNKITILPDQRIQIVNWNKYQTRYEKYYKQSGISDGINDGILDGTAMQGRIEEEGEEDKKKIYKKRRKKRSSAGNVVRDKTPTTQMFAIFSNHWNKHKAEEYSFVSGKDGKIAKNLYLQCCKVCPDAPLKLYEERVVALFEKRDIYSYGALQHFWNSLTPDKKFEGWGKK